MRFILIFDSRFCKTRRFRVFSSHEKSLGTTSGEVVAEPTHRARWPNTCGSKSLGRGANQIGA